jgi:hypothetical protein
MFRVDVAKGWDFDLFKQSHEARQASAPVPRPNHAETYALPGSKTASSKRDSRTRHTDKVPSIHTCHPFSPDPGARSPKKRYRSPAALKQKNRVLL